MSLSTVQKAAATTIVVAATAAVGFAVATDRVGVGDEAEAPAGSTVLAEPTGVQVVPDATPAQAAMAVSSRLFDRSEVAVLTSDDAESRASAVATAGRLGVPVLLDDPAAPAELARLRAETVLTFGEARSVVGATPIAGTEAEQERAVDAAVGSPEPPAKPERPAVLLVRSAQDFDVAVATAKSAGASVIESAEGDPRTDEATAEALAETPDSPVIAVGEPFTEDLEYALAAVQAGATQPDGSYLALPGHLYVALRGVPGDESSGPLGVRGVDGTLKLLGQVTAKHERGAARADAPATFVPTLEVLTAGQSLEQLTTVVDTAAEAEALVLLTLEPGDDSWVEQAEALTTLLARPNVGLAIDPGADGGDAGDVNEVGSWLADLVRADTLAQKLFVVHTGQDADLAVKDVAADRPELATVIQIDTIGSPQVKLAVWDAETGDVPQGAALGWAQNARGDRPVLSVEQLWARVRPTPSVIVYG